MTPVKWQRSWLVPGIVIAICMLALMFAIARYLPYAVDWHWALRPGCLAMLQGKSPYEVVPYFGFPPWSMLPLMPLALFPENIERAILCFASLLAFGYSVWRLGAQPVAFGAFRISPPVVLSLYNANLDRLPLLGFTMPSGIGLFFISTKPQMGSIVALFWLVQTWRSGGCWKVMRVFAPFGAVFIFSLFLFGFWPVHFREIQKYSQGWNASLWPASIPIGLALAVATFRRSEIRFAMAASPCLSPYALLHAWSGALASLAGLSAEMVAAVIGLWLLVIYRFLPAIW
jgi:hypothetical protein